MKPGQILWLVPVLMLLAGSVDAEPSEEVQALKSDPMTMFDYGLIRLQRQVENDFNEVWELEGIEPPDISVYYFEETNRIQITVSCFPKPRPSTTDGELYLRRLHLKFFEWNEEYDDAPAYTMLAGCFSHNMFRSPVSNWSNLADIIFFRWTIGATDRQGDFAPIGGNCNFDGTGFVMDEDTPSIHRR